MQAVDSWPVAHEDIHFATNSLFWLFDHESKDFIFYTVSVADCESTGTLVTSVRLHRSCHGVFCHGLDNRWQMSQATTYTFIS